MRDGDDLADLALPIGFPQILGLISLSLGIFNLLPIPLLDGGQIMVLGIEKVMSWFGKTLSMAAKERIQLTAVVLLLAAGTGERLGAGVPKAFVTLADRPLLDYSLEAIDRSGVSTMSICFAGRMVINLQLQTTTHASSSAHAECLEQLR